MIASSRKITSTYSRKLQIMELRSLAKSFNNSKESEMSSSASQRIMTIQTVMEISIYMMVK